MIKDDNHPEKWVCIISFIVVFDSRINNKLPSLRSNELTNKFKIGKQISLLDSSFRPPHASLVPHLKIETKNNMLDNIVDTNTNK